MMKSLLVPMGVCALILTAIDLTLGEESFAENQDPLAAGFRQPPKQARPSTYWLWLNGYVNRGHLEEEIKELSEAGISGLCLFDMGARGVEEALPPSGPAFMSEEWIENLAQAVRLAGNYGMDVQLAACSSWDLGGAWVQPHHASMGLYRAELVVDGPAGFEGVLPLPKLPDKAPRTAEGKPAFLSEVALLAVPGTRKKDQPLLIKNPGSVIDLSGKLDGDGRLIWKVPAGQWTLLRFVCANTGEKLKVPSPVSDGLATDHLSREATREFVQHLVDKLEPKLGDLRKTALKQLYLPSYEVRGGTWTPDLLEQFRKYRGYDMTPYLPALADVVVVDQETTDRFLYDYHKTLGDLLVDAYYRTASETAMRAGLGIEAEAGGPGPPVHQVPVDALKALGAIDEIRGEFWPFREDWDALWVVKETACAAHIYDRQRVHMEAFTGFYHWEGGPLELKPSADRAFCEGMNHVVWHTSCHQPPEAGTPGWVYGAGTHLSLNMVWWPKAKPFIDYLSRSSFLLQQGLFVGDVCFYYGDEAFNFVPPKHVDPSLGFGYDYDVANPEVILTRMSVRDGRVTLPNGMQYELLVLPDRDDMDWRVLQKIERLVRDGATVVGPKPIQSNGLVDRARRDAQVRKLGEQLWGPCDGRTVLEHAYGKGRIIWGRTLKAILRARGLGPDFHYVSPRSDTDLDYIHRRTKDADIYFVRNKKQHWEEVQAHFRVGEKAPELWFADSGRIKPQAVYQQTTTGISMPLRLAPGDAQFIVFRKPATSPHLSFSSTTGSLKNGGDSQPGDEVGEVTGNSVQLTAFRNGTYQFQTPDGRSGSTSIDQVPAAREIPGPWEVQFPPDWGAPDTVVFDQLGSWTEHPDEGIRYFSGIARYEKEIEIPAAWVGKDRKVLLDLGRLWAVGEVSLNGRSLGILWKPPYRVDLTPVLKPGKNRLAIEVANTWSNRLVGDAKSPPEKRYCKTNIERSGTPSRAWKDVPLHDSGLLGPVRLVPAVVREVGLTIIKPNALFSNDPLSKFAFNPGDGHVKKAHIQCISPSSSE